ncbi:hypothetical protein N476_25970 [Pseudoalteromonas luteoviolacea H33]|uniref:Uncharacterized protein n=1 Tax=Pseudoalteromonas luteoviolacea H33 TaxID=1365251 RepID=A0A167A8R6_9GAMM|nr:hypothetical protein N476_25970 [Pseudoalteromonas luteoviolacea H33]
MWNKAINEGKCHYTVLHQVCFITPSMFYYTKYVLLQSHIKRKTSSIELVITNT